MPGGEPLAIPTVAQTKAQSITSPAPGNNKEVPKAISDRPMPDVNLAMQQTTNAGSKGLNPKDAYVDKQGR